MYMYIHIECMLYHSELKGWEERTHESTQHVRNNVLAAVRNNVLAACGATAPHHGYTCTCTSPDVLVSSETSPCTEGVTGTLGAGIPSTRLSRTSMTPPPPKHRCPQSLGESKSAPPHHFHMLRRGEDATQTKDHNRALPSSGQRVEFTKPAKIIFNFKDI